MSAKRDTIVNGGLGLAALAVIVVGLAFAINAPMGDHHAVGSLTLPTILVAGVLDGFNPCAFGVLILFATFALGLATRTSLASGGAGRDDVRAASRTVLGLGAFFVAGVLVTYFLLGLGLLAFVVSISNFGANHLPSRLAALAAVGLGIWMLRDALLPGSGFRLQAPHALHAKMRAWSRSTSRAALFGGGVLIGLCTIPCSGAVYLAIVALLSSGTTAIEGVGLLALYNIAYIVPLVALLVLASRPGLIRTVNRWHLAHAEATRFAIGLLVLVLGFAILLTV